MPSVQTATTIPDPRVARPPLADERVSLVAFLTYQRLTLKVKCDGLSPEDLARRSVDRSALTLLGLIRHLAEGERFWFRQVMAGTNPPALFPGDKEAAFNVAETGPEMMSAAWEMWQAEVDFAEAFVAAATNLDVTGNEPGEGPVSLRWVLLHMIEEYARHNGHADLLREQIDGAVGL